MAEVSKNIIGYGICGPNEKYIKKTLESFKRLTDKTVILLNNATQQELIESYGFNTVVDDREWGKHQWKIKQDFIKNVVSRYRPDITICLDMDEEFTESTTRESLIEWFSKEHTAYCYIVNLWGDGYNKQYSFGNVRAWSWAPKDKMTEQFYEFEQKPVHCGLAPKWAYGMRRHAPFVVLHHGLKDEKDRMKRVKRYEKYDKAQTHISNPDYYEELKKPNSKADVLNVKQIEERAIEEAGKLSPPPHIQPLVPKQKNTVLVKRQHDGMVITVEKDRLQNQLQQTYHYKGQKYGFELI